jgi:hypothetical protein
MQDKSMSEKLGKNKNTHYNPKRKLFLDRDNSKTNNRHGPKTNEPCTYTHFIGEMLWQILDTRVKNDFKIKEKFLRWGSDEDYEKCSEDFRNARLHTLHPLHFISKTLVMIVDRLFDEYIHVTTLDETKDKTKSEGMFNINQCVGILKLLIRPKSAWIDEKRTQGYYATLSVRGYCYKKLLDIYKRTDNEIELSKHIRSLMFDANKDNDITKEYKLELSQEEEKFSKKRSLEQIYSPSPSSKVPR